MTDTESLTEAIEQYEEQLSQVQLALSITKNGPDKDNLLSLQSDIQELIHLTKENLNSVKESRNSNERSKSNTSDEDHLATEYALFKAVLEGNLEESENAEESKSPGDISVDIEDELKALEGTKCKAPHGSGWGGVSHHNAMVCSIHSASEDSVTTINDIKVRVMFTNPTHKEMLPCPYYLDGECRFSDDQCHYSHGEIVSLSSLQEYSEPNFSTIKMGSRVLAKQTNKLWHRAVVLRIPETEKDEYTVKFEANGTILELGLHDLFPLNDADLDMSNSSSSDSEYENGTEEPSKDQLVQQSLLTMNGNEALGSWERHTRGMGSKLMANMGYVIGTGLGKRADGRVEPVEATVLPAGKSLDHCMELRENAGGDKDLFSVQRRMNKEKRKMEQLREKEYQREIRRERSNVFNFINSTLGDKPQEDAKPGSSTDKTNLKSETSQKLNVASLQIGENIRRLEKDSSKLQESLGRHNKGTLPYNNIVLQYNQKQKEIGDLRVAEKKIVAEQNHRKTKAKLTIF